jgi:WD40 repeat protein
VLYLSMSPDGGTIVTGAGDETLRFWDVFSQKGKGGVGGGGGGGSGSTIGGGFSGRGGGTVKEWEVIR